MLCSVRSGVPKAGSGVNTDGLGQGTAAAGKGDQEQRAAVGGTGNQPCRAASGSGWDPGHDLQDLPIFHKRKQSSGPDVAGDACSDVKDSRLPASSPRPRRGGAAERRL